MISGLESLADPEDAFISKVVGSQLEVSEVRIGAHYLMGDHLGRVQTKLVVGHLKSPLLAIESQVLFKLLELEKLLVSKLILTLGIIQRS